ncbi:MAG: DNA polymerase III subunit alpha, partial [Sphaerochaetaceae bacterium]|nr:DNA polymerase III subunit alpha [Sphaerochaetaceae bacterium]
ITDHGNMFGVMDFYSVMQKEGIRPIPGCEFYISPEGMAVRDRNYYHLILLAMNDKGYHNLMELNSIAYIEGFYNKPRIDEEVLSQHSEGLICMSACLAGEIPQKLLSSDPQKAYEKAMWYKNLFGGRYYIEIQDHGLDEEKAVLPLLVKLARDLDIPLVATNDIHYINKDDANAQDILLCIGTAKKKSDTDRMKFETEEFYMKSGDEMASLFAEYPDAIVNTVKIAERCNFEINFPGPQLPEVEVPEPYVSTEEYLTSLAWEGLERRYPGYMGSDEQCSVLTKRLEFELSVILKMKFDSYFLIVRDYIYWAKTHNIPVGAGRGSGAGSLVAYCIDITNVDPIAHDLLFERFLNPDRVSLPDFDVDFCFEGRQDVIDYVTEKYGKDRVGQIATFGTLKAKAVVKDVARVLDIPFDESNSITKLILDVLPDEAKAEGVTSLLEWSMRTTPELQEIRERGGVYEELFDVSLRLENLARHVSTHACGVVIGRTPLKDYVPLYKDSKTGGISTQYTMTVLEQCGLVKMDFLGLKTLTLLKNTEKLIKRTNPEFSLEKIPDGDAATYAMMARGDSTMVFQFESPGMQKNLKLLEPTKFEELDAMTSLFRPGPMQFIPQYIDSKQGRMPISYPDPCLKELLEPTYGVMVYQEQVMKTAQIYAGFTLAEADTLRKIVGKKKKKEIPAQEEKFVARAVKLGHSEQQARDLFEHIKPFAGYGFNKSHSVCYTVLSYRTAYLKCNYPAQFFAANLTNEIGSGEKFIEYLEYVKSKGIKILPPDINKSDAQFNVVDGNIVYGLEGIKGVGAATVELILQERSKKVLNSGTMEGLIKSGAFDRFGNNRATLFSNFDDAVKSIREDREARSVGQNLLFGAEEQAMSSFEMKICPDYEFLEKLDLEKEYIGFYLSGHPLDTYRESWKACVRLNIAKPERIVPNIKYDLIGMITDFKAVTTKNGTRMGYVTIEDYNGRIEITVFPRQWAMYEAAVAVGKVFGFHGSFKEYNNRVSFSADIIYGDPLQMKPARPRRMYVEVNDSDVQSRDDVKEIMEVCLSHRGTAELEFRMYPSLDDEGKPSGKLRRIIADSQFCVDASQELSEALKGCAGVLDTYSD